MGFFSKILEKLGIGGAAAARTDLPTSAAAASASPAASAAVSPPPGAVALVDVVANLEKRAPPFEGR